MSRRTLTEAEQQYLLRRLIRANSKNSDFKLRPPAKMLAAMEAEAANSTEAEDETKRGSSSGTSTASSVPPDPKSPPAQQQQMQKSKSPAAGSPEEEQHSISSTGIDSSKLPELSQVYSSEDLERWKAELPVFSFDGPMPSWMEEALAQMGPAGEAYA